MYKIMIVEDDRTIEGVLASHLKTWDYDVQCVKEFQNVMEAFYAFMPHLVLLDITLPFYNGFYWCTQIRKASSVPVVFLSSAADNMNIVMAMNMGGDDFIEKPFDLSVLTAKIQAMLRRTYALTEKGDLAVLEHKHVVLNLKEASVSFEEKRTELSKNEFQILHTLMKHAGSIVTREELMITLWESDSFIDDNTLTVNVNRLRKRLEEIDVSDYIMTKKGMGYLIEA